VRVTATNAGWVAAVLYTGGSLTTAGIVALGAVVAGEDEVAILGGALWVFLLSMIILMSTITPWITGRPGSDDHAGH
jgi:hypothetical protein